MKLLSVNLARTMWFMHLNDLNPHGRSIEQNIICEIGKRYGFPKIPTAVELVEARQKNQPVVLTGGAYKNSKGIDIEVSLSIYTDALFADSRSSTTDSETFLEKTLEWVTNEFGVVDYKTLTVRRVYVSELYVSLDKSLNMLNPAFPKFANTLQEKVNTPFKNIKFEAASIGFWIDPNIKHVHVPFRLERQASIGFDEGRYYTVAPLKTEEHLDMLEALEKAMIG